MCVPGVEQSSFTRIAFLILALHKKALEDTDSSIERDKKYRKNGGCSRNRDTRA